LFYLFVPKQKIFLDKKKKKKKKNMKAYKGPNQNYLLTYGPYVRRAYKKTLKNMKEKQILFRLGFDNWVKEKAKTDGDFAMDSGLMYLKLRWYRSFNGTGRIFSYKDVEELISNLDAVDIIDVLGRSIRRKTRKEISNMGKEFYFVEKEATEPKEDIQMIPEYNPYKKMIVKSFADTFQTKLKELLLKEFVSLDTKEQIHAFYENIDSILSEMINLSLKDTTVEYRKKPSFEETKKDKREVILYNFDDVHKMMKSLLGTDLVEHGTEPSDFGNKMMRTFGMEIKNWMRKLPAIWKDIYSDIESKIGAPIQNRRNHPAMKTQESFSKSLKSDVTFFNTNPEKYLFDVCKGKIIGPNIKMGYLPMKNVGRKPKRSELFDDVDLPHKCIGCNTFQCQASKGRKVKGKIFKYSNRNMSCPETLFSERIGNGMYGKMMQMQNKIDESVKTDDVKVAILMEKGKKFIPEVHAFPVKSDLISKNMLVNRNTDCYKIKGNTLTLRKTPGSKQRIKCVEYSDKDLKNLVFLIEE